MNAQPIWRTVWLEQLLQDARYAFRVLHRNPGFTAVVVLTLALGVGLNTAVFSAVNSVLLQPLAYPFPERLVWMTTFDDRSTLEGVGRPDFVNWKEQATALDLVVAYTAQDSTLAT